MSIPILGDVRELLDAPNYVHLATLRADGSPRNWVVWVGLENDHILVCTSDAVWKAKDMRRDPRVALSVTETANPYRMAAIQGRVVEVRPDEDCRYMDPISFKYTNAPFPRRGPDRVCFVIALDKAAQQTLSFAHNPGRPARHHNRPAAQECRSPHQRKPDVTLDNNSKEDSIWAASVCGVRAVPAAHSGLIRRATVVSRVAPASARCVHRWRADTAGLSRSPRRG